MNSYFQKKFRKAQTTIELALFGSVLLFLIGAIVRTVNSTGVGQGNNYKAFRLAMTTSFRFSEGLVQGTSADGNSSRNSASVLVIEDRLSTTSAKYASVDRNPQFGSGNGTHSRNLFYPIDYGEVESLPMSDYFINGVHIPLTTADFGATSLSDNPAACNAAYTTVPNHPALSYVLTCASPGPGVPDDYCFDLDRNGTVDVGAALRPFFAWQWKFVPLGTIDVEDGDNVQVDVDCDLKEESIIERNGSSVRYLDSQRGDIDPSINTRDTEVLGRLPQGLLAEEANIFTYAQNPNSAGPDAGTYLQVDEGRLYATDGINRQFVRSTKKKDSLDVIQRIVRLNRNTGHFCAGAGDPAVPAARWLGVWNAANPNPVELCVNGPSPLGCFGPNTDRTCLLIDGQNTRIFVRSRIADRHGRQWVTDTEGDPQVNFVVPTP